MFPSPPVRPPPLTLEPLPGKLFMMLVNKELAGDMRRMDSTEGALERLGDMDRGRFFAECLGLVNGEKLGSSPYSIKCRRGVSL